jgi:hypothetical protein
MRVGVGEEVVRKREVGGVSDGCWSVGGMWMLRK